MEVLQTSHDMSKGEIFKLTHSQQCGKLSERVNQVVELAAWCIFTDDDRTILTIADKNGELCATNSDTFIRAFTEMVDYFDTEPVNTILVVGGVSKNGRDFITCEYVY